MQHMAPFCRTGLPDLIYLCWPTIFTLLQPGMCEGSGCVSGASALKQAGANPFRLSVLRPT